MSELSFEQMLEDSRKNYQERRGCTRVLSLMSKKMRSF